MAGATDGQGNFWHLPDGKRGQLASLGAIWEPFGRSFGSHLGSHLGHHLGVISLPLGRSQIPTICASLGTPFRSQLPLTSWPRLLQKEELQKWVHEMFLGEQFGPESSPEAPPHTRD